MLRTLFLCSAAQKLHLCYYSKIVTVNIIMGFVHLLLLHMLAIKLIFDKH